MHPRRAACLLLASAALPAWAHGDRPHATRPAGAPRDQHAWGRAGLAADVKRSVTVRMTDAMRFAPDRLQFRLGETARLMVHNQGAVLHELVLGTEQALDEHAALMLKFPGMEHDEPHMAHVKPGARGEIVWHFNRTGAFHFACLIAGHYQAGMRGRFEVRA